MTIYALKAPATEEQRQFIYGSLKQGKSRFGWSYIDTADLKKLEPKPFKDLSDDESSIYRSTRFLLDVNQGDWVVHINLPGYGKCVAAQVKSGYSFDIGGGTENDGGYLDFRHTLDIDIATIVEFDRNDNNVLPIISSRLKLQSKYWRIYHENEFLQSLHNIKSNTARNIPANESANLFHLKQNLSPILKQITERIQHYHPSSHLEAFMAKVFLQIPGAEVKENGLTKGFGTDNGADLIVRFKSKLSDVIGISEIRQETLVVQIKSFIGDHLDTSAVEQIKDAINKFDADAGLIITTAQPTQPLLDAIEKANVDLNGKRVVLIAGEDVAKFVLKYGSDLIV